MPDASPGPIAGVHTWGPCTPWRICCHALWLQFHPGLLHFSTKELTTLQWLLQIHVRMCLWQLSASTSVCGVMKCIKRTWSARTWRDQGAKEGIQMRQWMLAIIWISKECLSWDFWNSSDFFCLKNSWQISSTLVQLKKMFIFEGRNEQVKESDSVSASPEPYCNRKCKVIESVAMFQSQKVIGLNKKWKKKRVPYLCPLSSWAFCLASCHNLRTVTSLVYGRCSFLFQLISQFIPPTL